MRGVGLPRSGKVKRKGLELCRGLRVTRGWGGGGVRETSWVRGEGGGGRV